MSDGHTQSQIDAGFDTVRLLAELAHASGVSGNSDDVVRGATARIRELEAELAHKAIKDKMVEQARVHLLAALGLHQPGQCPGVGCGCECLCVEELAGMAAKELAEYKEAVSVLGETCRMAIDDNPDHDRDFIGWNVRKIANPIARAALEGSKP